MCMRKVAVSAAAFGIIMLGSSAGWAGKADHGYIGSTGRVEPHARFPNDIAYDFGTVSRRGSKTEPYVERCYWTFEPTAFFFKHLKQVCTRHTLENTQ
jgi:hypothetical protein